MITNIKDQLRTFLSQTLDVFFSGDSQCPEIEMDVPAEKQHGEFSSNIALKSAKILKKSPMIIAQEFYPVLLEALERSPLKPAIAKIEVKNPGFINFHLSPSVFYQVISDALQAEINYGRNTKGQNQRVLVEFVSANPTGPLSVAHARQAAVGDSLVNIFNFLGYEAKKEYYVNDGGNQINILGKSLRCRALEILGEETDFPEDGYKGAYIKNMAEEFLEKYQIRDVLELKALETGRFNDFGKEHLLTVIRKELDDFRVEFDEWSFESQVATPERISEMLARLKAKGLTYENEGALWFKTTEFGDDKDRVLQKRDRSYTYLTPDIVYHKNKYERGFALLIDILGPDHHGYIQRLNAAAQALGRSPART